MQETRQFILEILKLRGEATVDDIVTELRQRRGDHITAVTVRHHLNELLKENLITAPQLQHRSAPGRPRHVYTLTDEARNYFPNNYQSLAVHLVDRLAVHLPPKQFNVLLEDVADSMAAEAEILDLPLAQRIEVAVEYLNQHGYSARWEKHPEGFILQTTNCPYHHVAESNQALCHMDMRLVASLLGVVPRLMGRMSSGDNVCAYFIPAPAN